MKATREEMKAEAIVRMKQLRIINDAILQFKNDDIVMISEKGILYWLDEDQEKAVKEWEDKSGALVYMVIRSWTEFGELYSMLYVPSEMEYWKEDREDLKEGLAFAYVKNLSDPTSSECGMIGVRNRFGGLIRTA